MNVSVFIQTLNEEANIPRCLASLEWSDDIVVLDSLSTDRTEEIVRAAGGRFFQRPYDGRAKNQNWAVENIDFKHPWVWYVDADEVTPPKLVEEILDVTSDPGRNEVAYFVRRKNMFMGKWLKHGGMYNVWITRLWKPEKMQWERGANPIACIDGEVGYLKQDFIHYFFSKGFDGWFERHNRYSGYEAVETIKSLESGALKSRDFLSHDPMIRRNALKHLSFRLPLRPLAKFLFMYFARLGFLDGRPGWTYCLLQAVYEAMIVAKVREIRRAEKGLSM